MAKEIENDCVGCEHCINCGRKHAPHYYCDGECGEEFSPDELYDFEGDMLCVDCLVKQFRKVSERSD